VRSEDDLQVREHVKKFDEPDLYLAILALAETTAAYAVLLAAYPWFTKHWVLYCMGVFLSAAVKMRIFVIFHDCSHG
jgi:fatty acid desaturase